MVPWYTITRESCRYSNIEEIRYSDIKDKLVKIELFSLNELIKLYPNFKKIGEYIIFGENLFFNYYNYLLFENNSGYGGNGKIITFKSITETDLIPGETFNLCSFLKYPFKDIYIQSGIYIYNWMVKSISIYPMITIDKYRRISTLKPKLRNEIDCLYKVRLKRLSHKSLTEFGKKNEFKQIIETPDGFQLNF